MILVSAKINSWDRFFLINLPENSLLYLTNSKSKLYGYDDIFKKQNYIFIIVLVFHYTISMTLLFSFLSFCLLTPSLLSCFFSFLLPSMPCLLHFWEILYYQHQASCSHILFIYEFYTHKVTHNPGITDRTKVHWKIWNNVQKQQQISCRYLNSSATHHSKFWVSIIKFLISDTVFALLFI